MSPKQKLETPVKNKTEETEAQEKILEKTPSERSMEEDAESDASETSSKDKKEKRRVEAKVNIYTSFNNTIVHVTDMAGRTLTKVTGGMVTKHGRLKANPTIAMFIAKRVA